MTEQEAAVQAIEALLQGSSQSQSVSSWVSDWVRTGLTALAVAILGAIWKFLKGLTDSIQSLIDMEKYQETKVEELGEALDHLRQVQSNQGGTLQVLALASKHLVRQQDPEIASVMFDSEQSRRK